jgi:hypothetical protein
LSETQREIGQAITEQTKLLYALQPTREARVGAPATSGTN